MLLVDGMPRHSRRLVSPDNHLSRVRQLVRKSKPTVRVYMALHASTRRHAMSSKSVVNWGRTFHGWLCWQIEISAFFSHACTVERELYLMLTARAGRQRPLPGLGL
jgi:hypothetical protein